MTPETEMRLPGNVTEFTHVDGSTDAAWFIDFMDAANALPEYAEIRRNLAEAMGELPGRTVLDVGCGPGDDARDLAELGAPDGRVVAVDVSEVMVSEARRRHAGSTLRVEYLRGDIRRMDFLDGAFDATRAKLVLMHCEDIEAGLNELVRVTKPGGRIVAFDYDFDTTIADHPDVETTRTMLRCFSDGHRNNLSGRQLRRRFVDRGMREVCAVPHTVILPFAFFHTMVAGRLASTHTAGRLAISGQAFDDWWTALQSADAEGKFFASFTGFVVAGTRPRVPTTA